MSKEIFDFSEALRRMKEGKKVRRNGCYFSLSINKYKEYPSCTNKVPYNHSPMLYHIIGISSPWMIFLQQTGRRWKNE